MANSGKKLEVTISARKNADDFVRHVFPAGLIEQIGFKTLAIEKGSRVDTDWVGNFWV